MKKYEAKFGEQPDRKKVYNNFIRKGKAGEGKARWYFANTRSEACPQGSGQEETIKAIWAADSK